MQQSGYLLLADISGYTGFVTRTEIDHSAEILQSLIRVVISETRPPFRVQEIEGDAVFSHARTGELGRGVLLVELVDCLYGSFRSALEDIGRNSTCTCRACAQCGSLDLKFIVHHGAFATRAIPGHEGISGPDVILAHRLLKNRVRETTGCSAYAFFTAAAVQASGMGEAVQEMVRHEETYEHLGTVEGYVYDVARQWEQMEASRSVTVSPETAFLVRSFAAPVSRPVAWEFCTDPRYREQWLEADRLVVEARRAGRYAVGTIEHCVHGRETSVLRTVDWKPMRYFTQDIRLPLGGSMLMTTALQDDGDQTRVSIIVGKPTHERPLARGALRVLTLLIGPSLRKSFTLNAERLSALLRTRSVAVADASP